MTSIILRLALGVFFLSSLGIAQPGLQAGRAGSAYVSYEAIPFLRDDTSRTAVHIHYRIREDFFIILRNTESPERSAYIGRGELAVELLTENGTSVAREIRQIRLARKNLPREDDQPGDVQGIIALTAPEGTYRIVFSVEDKQSERSFLDRARTITTRKPDRGRFDISSPLFVQAVTDSSETTYQALNRGTDILFGDSGGLLFALSQFPVNAAIVVSYTLTNKPDFDGLDPQRFSGTNSVVTPGIPEPSPRNEETSPSGISYRINPSFRGWGSLFIPLPFERLLPGESELLIHISAGIERREIPLRFRVHWFTRPFSLMNFEMAVDALSHIATDDEMSAFRTFSSSGNAKAFFEFWKRKDPDTTTAYNELMTEYYRRVDIAMRQYSTIRENDGYKTDRGRIFVLYGTPTNTQRVFSPENAPREIWTYSNLKRRFVFEDTRKNGTFVLIKTEDL